MTPRYFSKMVERQRRSREDAGAVNEYMLAQLIAMVANTGFRSFKEVRQPREFVVTKPQAAETQRIDRRKIARRTEFALERAAQYQDAQVQRGQPQ